MSVLLQTCKSTCHLNNKVDKHTSILSKFSAQGCYQNKQFDPKTYLGKRRGQGRNKYDHGRHQGRYRLNSGDRYGRPSYRGRSQYGEIIERVLVCSKLQMKFWERRF